MRTSRPRVAPGLGFAVPLALALTLAAAPARATNVSEFPDNGSEQMARGGAWIARASDPLAAMFNPAGLAGQPTRVTLQNNLIFEHTCFTRIKGAGDTSNDPLGASGAFPRVCNDVAPTFNPQVGATFRLTDRVGLGLLVIGPSSAGEKTFPDFVPDGSGQLQAAPNRYLLAKQAGLILFPTVAVGVEIVDNLRIGAAFSWGIARLRLATATMALNTDNAQPSNDIRANVQVQDYFIPAASLGALWSASPELDLAATYRVSDAIRAYGDVGTAANFYTRANAEGDDKNVRYGDTIFEDCGTGLPTTACKSGDNGRVKIAIPMEAKLGVRYHKLRADPDCASGQRGEDGRCKHVRDPLATDVFDVEANLTWANNSAMDPIQIRFPQDGTGRGILPVAGVAGGEIPPNADQPRGYKDVFGVRVGGDYNVVPDRLALRAGAFFETSALDAKYQSIDFAAAARFGLALGATYRIPLGRRVIPDPAPPAPRDGADVGEAPAPAPAAPPAPPPPPALELMVGFGHVFVAEQSRTDPRADGVLAIAGTSCNRSDAVSASSCADGSQRYRSKWPVNLGTITNSLNVINVGLAYRF